MDWTRLDKDQSHQFLTQVNAAADPNLFSINTSDASFKPLPFYEDYMVYRVTNYATLPSYSMDFLSNGESYFLLDGSPTPIETVNKSGGLYLTEANIIAYIEFYLSNISAEDGDIYLLQDIDTLPFINSLSVDQIDDLKARHVEPKIARDKNTAAFVILADLFYAGTLMQSAIIVARDGSIDIQPRDMIMNGQSANYDDGAAIA